MKKLLLTAALSTFVLTGCNTVNGLGQDLTKAGSAISKAANGTKTKLSNMGNNNRNQGNYNNNPYQ